MLCSLQVHVCQANKLSEIIQDVTSHMNISTLMKHNSSIWSNQNTPLLPSHRLSVED